MIKTITKKLLKMEKLPLTEKKLIINTALSLMIMQCMKFLESKGPC